MGLSKVHTLIVFEKVMNKIESWPELIRFYWHRLDGDDCVIFMLSRSFTTKSNPSSDRMVPTMVDLKVADEERTWIDREVGHVLVVAIIGEVSEVGVFFGVYCIEGG
jgi:hypothetical protein